MKRKFKMSIICLALVMTMLVGTSLSALAYSGNISFGGTTFEWNISRSNLSIKMTNRTATQLEVKGSVYAKDSGGHYLECKADGYAGSSTLLSYNVKPDTGYSYYEHDDNKLVINVGGSKFTECKPQPS